MLGLLQLCNPVDFSPPGSSICGILQARILAIPFFREPFPSLGIFPTQGLNQGFLHCRCILLLFEPPGKPKIPCTNKIFYFDIHRNLKLKCPALILNMSKFPTWKKNNELVDYYNTNNEGYNFIVFFNIWIIFMKLKNIKNLKTWKIDYLNSFGVISNQQDKV